MLNRQTFLPRRFVVSPRNEYPVGSSRARGPIARRFGAIREPGPSASCARCNTRVRFGGKIIQRDGARRRAPDQPLRVNIALGSCVNYTGGAALSPRPPGPLTGISPESGAHEGSALVAFTPICILRLLVAELILLVCLGPGTWPLPAGLLAAGDRSRLVFCARRLARHLPAAAAVEERYTPVRRRQCAENSWSSCLPLVFVVASRPMRLLARRGGERKPRENKNGYRFAPRAAFQRAKLGPAAYG